MTPEKIDLIARQLDDRCRDVQVAAVFPTPVDPSDSRIYSSARLTTVTGTSEVCKTACDTEPRSAPRSAPRPRAQSMPNGVQSGFRAIHRDEDLHRSTPD